MLVALAVAGPCSALLPGTPFQPGAYDGLSACSASHGVIIDRGSQSIEAFVRLSVRPQGDRRHRRRCCSLAAFGSRPGDRPSNVSRRSAADDVLCQPWDACSRTLARPTTAMPMPRKTHRRPSSIRGECRKSVYEADEDLDPVFLYLERRYSSVYLPQLRPTGHALASVLAARPSIADCNAVNGPLSSGLYTLVCIQCLLGHACLTHLMLRLCCAKPSALLSCHTSSSVLSCLLLSCPIPSCPLSGLVPSPRLPSLFSCMFN